jgi:hypothetical protein
MAVQARRLIRKMRGGAQAHLLEADDGHCYVVKFKNNPQHRRILVNELVASVLLRYVQISAPESAVVELTAAFLRDHPGVRIQLGSRQAEVEPGRHFGSRFPGDPERVAVYDYLPDALLVKVANLRDFAGVYAFDRWAGNADARQSIFFRASMRDSEGEETSARMVAWMVDHGFLFDGPNWRFGDGPLQGLYHRSLVYEQVREREDFQPWIERIRHMPEEVIDQAFKQVPREWLDGDEGELEKVLQKLLDRRKRIDHLVEDACQAGRAKAFPNWRGSRG